MSLLPYILDILCVLIIVSCVIYYARKGFLSAVFRCFEAKQEKNAEVLTEDEAGALRAHGGKRKFRRQRKI